MKRGQRWLTQCCRRYFGASIAGNGRRSGKNPAPGVKGLSELSFSLPLHTGQLPWLTGLGHAGPVTPRELWPLLHTHSTTHTHTQTPPHRPPGDVFSLGSCPRIPRSEDAVHLYPRAENGPKHRGWRARVALPSALACSSPRICAPVPWQVRSPWMDAREETRGRCAAMVNGSGALPSLSRRLGVFWQHPHLLRQARHRRAWHGGRAPLWRLGCAGVKPLGSCRDGFLRGDVSVLRLRGIRHVGS